MTDIIIIQRLHAQSRDRGVWTIGYDGQPRHPLEIAMDLLSKLNYRVGMAYEVGMAAFDGVFVQKVVALAEAEK